MMNNFSYFTLFGSMGLVWYVWREFMYYHARCTIINMRNDYQERERHSSQEISGLRQHNEYLQQTLRDHVGLIMSHRKEMENSLQGLCAQTLHTSQQAFMSLVEPLIAHWQDNTHAHLKDHASWVERLVLPLEKNLTEMNKTIHSMEKERVGAYENLREHIQQLVSGHHTLVQETNTLSTALRSPNVRGCWGEMQLKRVVELAGMTSYCDFSEQSSLETEKKNTLKPDMIIHLPGKKTVLVDAKAPLLHYLEGVSAQNSKAYALKMKEHAKSVAGHIKALGDKKYWAYERNSVEFTILFLPGEAFLSAALESDPTLIEKASDQQIILATPIILIALLKTIAQGWRHENFSQETVKIMHLSKDLYQKLEKFHTHIQALGKALKAAHTAYQDAFHLLDHTVMPLSRRLYDSQKHEDDVNATQS